jgi:hypothetical protein
MTAIDCENRGICGFDVASAMGYAVLVPALRHMRGMII